MKNTLATILGKHAMYISGLFVALVLFLLVQYIVKAVDPSTVPDPTFSPTAGDVSLPERRFACNWVGSKPLNFGCEGGDTNGCGGFGANCQDGRVISFGNVGGHINEGPTKKCSACGVSGWTLEL